MWLTPCITQMEWHGDGSDAQFNPGRKGCTELRCYRTVGKDQDEAAAILKAGNTEALEGLPPESYRSKMVCRSRRSPQRLSLDGLPINREVGSDGLWNRWFAPPTFPTRRRQQAACLRVGLRGALLSLVGELKQTQIQFTRKLTEPTASPADPALKVDFPVNVYSLR